MVVKLATKFEIKKYFWLSTTYLNKISNVYHTFIMISEVMVRIKIPLFAKNQDGG